MRYVLFVLLLIIACSDEDGGGEKGKRARVLFASDFSKGGGELVLYEACDDGDGLKALTKDTLSIGERARWTRNKAYIFAESGRDTIHMLTAEGNPIDFINGYDPYPFFDDERIIYLKSRLLFDLWVMDYYVSCNPLHAERLRDIHENVSLSRLTIAVHPLELGFVFLGKKNLEQEKNLSIFTVDENWNYTMTLIDSVSLTSCKIDRNKYSAAYSPEGDQLFLHAKGEGTKWACFQEKTVKDYDFGLEEGEEIESMAWSDDPDKIALGVSSEGKSRIYIYHIPTRKLKIFREETEFKLYLCDYR